MRKVLDHCRPAVASAKTLVETLRIRDPAEIDIELIAAHLGLHVVYKRLANEEGHLVRNGSGGLIVVNETARETAKWRWVIGHEVGHFRQHAGTDQFEVCTERDLHAWYLKSGLEAQANAFAAELLMPEAMFKPRCAIGRPSLDNVGELATAFRTSLTATALRFIAFSPEPCAIVHSTASTIDWWASTEDFGFTLKNGFKLSTRTYAGDLFQGRAVPTKPSVVDGDGWSDDSRAGGIEVAEHSIVLGRFGAVLSLLWHTYQDDDDD